MASADAFSAKTAVARARVSTATVYGYVDTGGQQTTFSFQYGPTDSYGQSSQSAVIPAGQTGPVLVEAQLGGLTPGTAYHFRVVAQPTGSSASGASSQSVGADATFTTEPAHLALDHGVLLVVGRHASMKLGCESADACVGTVTLTLLSARRRVVRCAAVALGLGAWQTKDLVAKLSDGCVKRLHRAPRHQLRATMSGTLSSGQQALVRRVLLRTR